MYIFRKPHPCKVRRSTYMWGFWNGGPAVFRVNLVVGLIGGLAKFNFSALRLPDRGEAEFMSDCTQDIYGRCRAKNQKTTFTHSKTTWKQTVTIPQNERPVKQWRGKFNKSIQVNLLKSCNPHLGTMDVRVMTCFLPKASLFIFLCENIHFFYRCCFWDFGWYWAIWESTKQVLTKLKWITSRSNNRFSIKCVYATASVARNRNPLEVFLQDMSWLYQWLIADGSYIL